MRIPTLFLLGVAVLSAPVATAQDLTVERDGSQITITQPDGTVERFTVDEDAALRVRVKDSPLIVEREEGEDGPHRRFEMWHRGDGPAVWFEGDDKRPRAFAFRTRPDGAPFGLEGLDLEADVDSMLQGMMHLRGMPDGLDVAFGGKAFMPWPGFGGRGVRPETRRAIAEAERESRKLARQFRRAEGAERDRLADELRATLERTFDLKQQARRERIEHLQQEAERLQNDLAELNDELAEREQARREIIERRQRELLGEADELDW